MNLYHKVFMRRIFCFLSVAIFLSFLLFVQGCTKLPSKGSQKPKVIVTIPPYVYIVKAIAGDTVDVEPITGPSFDPHTSEISPSKIRSTLSADLLICSGEAYEPRLIKMINEGSKPISILEIQKNIQLLCFDQKSHSGCNHSAHNHEDSSDLHFWLSPTSLIEQSKLITTALYGLQPQFKADYVKKNLELEDKLSKLYQQIKLQLAPFKDRSIITSHASLGYFCHDFDINQLAIEYEGKNPRLKTFNNILSRARSSNPICAFGSPQYNNTGIELVAKELDLRIEYFDPVAEEVLDTIKQVADDIAR